MIRKSVKIFHELNHIRIILAINILTKKIVSIKKAFDWFVSN